MFTVTLVVVLLLVIVPAVPIAIAWYKATQQSDGPHFRISRNLIPLCITTLSFIWLLIGLYRGAIIGPDYSDLRFVVIYANLAAVVVSLVMAAFIKSPVKVPLALSASVVAVEWLYCAVVSSVV
ncbi:MAG: hypothetical protein JWQ87_5281 [Candidatus Sulfotelmatobacter sp.]|nr:hypothetical protein [Candidatus Sulfotelmatobacter sp.]